MLPMAGQTAGLIKTKLGIGTHVDPRSVLVKVKVIYLCVRCNRIHDRIQDRQEAQLLLGDRATQKHAKDS